MKAIEERANEYAFKGKLASSHLLNLEKDYIIGKQINAYIAGATEQKEIDDAENGKALLYAGDKTTKRVKKEMIDKACEWLKDNTKEYVEWGGYELVPAMLQNFYKAFRKAMEE